ncbi:hypothetical protein Btru_046439 [Bulinus truncatus]|nr:hypothetical protein Btru_046439 [Bulinus truncatus]
MFQLTTPVQQLGAKIEITQKNELKKFNVSLADEGNYSCEGVEKNNSTIRRNFTIVVLVGPDIKVYPVTPKSVREGHTLLKRMCKTRGKPQPTIEWFTNKQQRVNVSENSTSPSERIYVEEKQEGNETISVLIIQPVLYTDNGVYTCFAINEHSAVRNLTFVDVRYSPKSLAPSKSTQLVQWWEGAKVNLTCMADGNPPPKITWSYDADAEETDFNCSVEYVGDYYMNKTIARSTCWIQSTDNSSFQGGNYSCSAENAHGKILVQNFIVQRINPPPAVDFQLVRKTSNDFIMDVNVPTVEGSPPAEHVLIRYRQINSLREYEFLAGVDPNGHLEVPLPGILPGKHYEISIAARNIAGYGARKFTVQWSGDKLTPTVHSPITTHKIQPYNITKNTSSDVAQVNFHTNCSTLPNVTWLGFFFLFVLTFVCNQPTATVSATSGI